MLNAISEVIPCHSQTHRIRKNEGEWRWKERRVEKLLYYTFSYLNPSFILPNKCNLLTDLRPDNEVWNVESESETSSLPNWMTEANMFWRVSNAQRVPDGAKYVWKSRDTSGK